MIKKSKFFLLKSAENILLGVFLSEKHIDDAHQAEHHVISKGLELKNPSATSCYL